MRRSTKLVATLVAFGLAACSQEEAAAGEGEAEAIEGDPFGDTIDVVSDEEAAAEAEQAITEENADEEFEKLKRELEEGN